MSVSVVNSNNVNIASPLWTSKTEQNNQNRKNSTTTNSIGSNRNISIETLSDSSVVDSDSDSRNTASNSCDYNPNNGIVSIENLGQPNNSYAANNNHADPCIDNVVVNHSNGIQFGTRTIFTGPVTIKQFVYDQNKEKETNSTRFHDDAGHVNGKKDHTTKWSKCINKKAISVIIIASIAAVLVLVLIGSSGDNSQSKDPIGNDTIPSYGVVERSEWDAQPPAKDIPKLELPSTKVIIAHTVTPKCYTQKKCAERVRSIQSYHINLDSVGDDISYNFLVGSDGKVYVGRGWDVEGGHTRGYNKKSICISFIGNFTDDPPPPQQLLAAQRLIAEGVKLGKISKDYKLHGHSQLLATESPGRALYKIIKTWDHWSEKIDPK